MPRVVKIYFAMVLTIWGAMALFLVAFEVLAPPRNGIEAGTGETQSGSTAKPRKPGPAKQDAPNSFQNGNSSIAPELLGEQHREDTTP